ncbi:tartrate dehydrogenase [Bacillus sp. SCS-153A]|uniref:tartrate dehydrogenase n=1 Tax=Rossellomorea sedimentorum TaxID=3115294 RepID=UPI003906B7BA
MDKTIALLPGDGIGPEVMKEAVKILDYFRSEGLALSCETLNWNSDFYLQHGIMMPEDGLEQLSRFDAILFGAIGDKRVPDEIPIWELIMPIRKSFQQCVNFRPVKLLKGLSSPLKNVENLDFVIIRENAEGEYSNIGGRMFNGEDRELAVQNTVMTRQGISQVVQYAFEYAKENGYDKVTSATKSNAIIHVMKFWDEVAKQVSNQYEDIKYEEIYIDALAAFFVMKPQSFQVVVSSNLFGDILSDLGSALVGGLGVAPSANINPTKEYPSMFEPVHGSAPDIAGKGIANPVAQIWSLSLMLDHLGYREESRRVMDAIEQVLQAGESLTPDLGGEGTTEELGNAILAYLRKT